MNARYRVTLDPHSDDDRDWVVWDDKTSSTTFQATQHECDVIARELNEGRSYADAERAENP